MRIAPGLLIVLMIFVDTLLFPSGDAFRNLCPDILAGACLFLMYPLSYEDGRLSLGAASATFVILLLVRVALGFSGQPVKLMALPLLAAHASYRILRTGMKYRNVHALLRMDGIWCKVEDDALSFYGKVYLAILALYLMSDPLGLRHIASLLLSLGAAVLFVVLYFRAVSGKTCFIGRRKESEVKRMTLEWEEHPEMDPGMALQMERIFGRVENYMNDRKPYLEYDFSLDSLADALFCNKAYISKAINHHSGKNFRQYVNHYRIRFASQLMDVNPHIRVMEVASRSGFHSMVTFTMAFKLNMNVTPGEYRTALQARRLR